MNCPGELGWEMRDEAKVWLKVLAIHEGTVKR